MEYVLAALLAIAIALMLSGRPLKIEIKHVLPAPPPLVEPDRESDKDREQRERDNAAKDLVSAINEAFHNVGGEDK